MEHVLYGSTDRTEDNGKVQHARLGPLVRDFSSESNPVVLVQLFDRFKRGRVLSDEGTLLEKVRDVRHVSLLREPLDIAQELIFRDTSQGVLNPRKGESM